MTPAQIKALGDVATDADLITLYRYALANGWAGTTRTVGGSGGTRTVVFPAPGELLTLIERLEVRVAATAAPDDDSPIGRVSLVRFRDPTQVFQ